ncbi:MAG: class A beta-lactamase [Ottowia sp.]|nr:class A beta-lactamase [Ottowia sp.]
MKHSPNRRVFLLATALLPFATWAARSDDVLAGQMELARLEKMFGGRLGVFALNTGDNAQLSYRANERFPVCSTFKVLLAAAILVRSTHVAGLMQKRIKYTHNDLVTYSPITEKHIENGMTVAELCAAVMQYGDNTASNLLMKVLGGPAAVTAFARSIGDDMFSLERWETKLNSAIPGDLRDTSTPYAMGHSLHRIVFGNVLKPDLREQFQDWLRGNTTGAASIRAGVPIDWVVGNRTGTGDYGTTNDIAVIWPPHRPPIVVAIYTTQHDRDTPPRSDVIALAARIVANCLS